LKGYGFRVMFSPIKSNLIGPKEKAKNIFACPQKIKIKCNGKKTKSHEMKKQRKK
jgi:hypothetical protein